ncbi:MAG TPA: hypothetical protein VGF76_23900 [Polyangiaceae bacterium]
MRASLKLTRALALTCAGAIALGVSLGCANKKQTAEQASVSAVPALSDLPEPRGVLAELTLSHPGVSFKALRELGGAISALLPAGFPLLVSSVLGLPPLSADSFDPELPAFGVLVQGASGGPSWVLAVHAVSGPELVAKLCTGDHAPFRAAAGNLPGLTLLQPSSAPASAAPKPERALAVFDNYLLVADSADALSSAGPFAARMLPKRSPPQASVALRFSKQALSAQVVPALRGLWAGYRTNLSHLDQSARSAHGGRAPDFGDPAQVILGADAVVESLLSLIDDATTLELDLEPAPNRLEATLLLQPDAGSEAESKLASLAAGTAAPLLTLPAETQFALGLSRTPADRDAAGKAAGDDWVRLLGPRMSEPSAQQLRVALADWELGRGTVSSYGFVAGSEPGAFLVTDTGDAARLRRAGPELFGLLALPGIRAPLSEFLGQPHVADGAVGNAAPFPNVSRKQLTFTPSAGHKASVPPLSFAWLIDDKQGFAAAGRNADPLLKQVVESAHGQGETLASKAGISDGVQRIGDQAALFAYADARFVGLMAEGGASAVPAPLLLALGKRASVGYLRLEISKPAIDLALHSALGL